jgi:Xaa-Pro dipeptidase
LEERLDRSLAAADALGLDATLVTSDESIAYLTGFRPMQLERFFGVVLRRRGSAVIVPALDEGQLDGAPARLKRISYPADSDGIPELVGALGDARTVGVEEDHLIYARARALADRGFELVPAGSVVLELRIRKDAGEIERIRTACELVEEGLRRVFAELRIGITEHAANAGVEAWLREQGASEAHPLILFGENAANPHAEPGSRELRAGDVVCADLSACLDGYWGDLTRCGTVGAPSEWARRAWAVVREAQRTAIDATRVGVPARDVDRAQREIVEAAAELGACLHGAGHAIGLAVHEPPFLVPRSGEPLPDGCVLTIEPGIYKAGVGGIRLEDDVVVREAGAELLSSLALELLELG